MHLEQKQSTSSRAHSSENIPAYGVLPVSLRIRVLSGRSPFSGMPFSLPVGAPAERSETKQTLFEPREKLAFQERWLIVTDLIHSDPSRYGHEWRLATWGFHALSGLIVFTRLCAQQTGSALDMGHRKSGEKAVLGAAHKVRLGRFFWNRRGWR